MNSQYNAPCLGCTERTAVCHDPAVCERWAAYKDYQKLISENKRKSFAGQKRTVTYFKNLTGKYSVTMRGKK